MVIPVGCLIMLLARFSGPKYEKRPLKSDPFVIRLGFEPKTHSLEGCCSIQLSYRTNPLIWLAKVVKKSYNQKFVI